MTFRRTLPDVAPALYDEVRQRSLAYWYNGFIYESEETKGFNVFGLNDSAVANTVDFAYLNP